MKPGDLPETNPAGSASVTVSRRDGRPFVVLVRHGETEWSSRGRHTSRTDLHLTRAGEGQAVVAGLLIRRVLGDASPTLVVSSPSVRAVRTAELAGYPPTLVTADAAEWDYGDLEGETSPEIRQRMPGWTIWQGPVPNGESSDQVSERIDRLLARIRGESAGPVLVFSHGHASRCLAARWLGLPVGSGRLLTLSTGAVSALGYEHDEPVVQRWNVDRALAESAP